MTVISNRTRNILRNFAAINNSIVIKPGNQVRTLSINKNILASAVVGEEFEHQISIYDLSAFISGVDLFSQTELQPESNYVRLIDTQDSRRQSRFYYADPEIIVQPPENDLALPSVDVQFNLSAQDYVNLMKAARLYKVADACVFGDGNTMQLCVTDKKNETSNSYAVEVGKTDKEFCHCFKIENLNIIEADYHIEISNSKVAKFSTQDLSYWIALEP
jgi:hypothetical protein